MLGEYVFNESNAAFCTSVLLVDHDVEECAGYAYAFERRGFVVVRWGDDLAFRVRWEEALKAGEKLAVVAHDGDYVPYDLALLMQRYDVTLGRLFPKLDTATLQADGSLDLDMLALAYERDYVHTSDAKATRVYLETRVNVRETAEALCDELEGELVRMASGAAGYRDWIAVAQCKARIDVTAARYGFGRNTNALTDGAFRDFVATKYGQLSMAQDDETPVLVSGAMEYMRMRSDRFAVVVMDGMSEFDWRVLRESFAGIPYEESAAFAMVPTVTSLSRQSLLGGKYPKDLLSPWTTGKEKNEFFARVRDWGVGDKRIAYLRGYDAELPYGCDFCAFIILDVDERVHGQYGGRPGMLGDMELLRDSGKLAGLVRRLTAAGLDVYITADHGNTPCVGRGHVSGTGVETETKSRRMLVLKDFAEVEPLKEKYGLIEYPGTFLDKTYRYYVCPSGVSFDNPGESVMSHGGMSIDEVIVPFVSVKAGASIG